MRFNKHISTKVKKHPLWILVGVMLILASVVFGILIEMQSCANTVDVPERMRMADVPADLLAGEQVTASLSTYPAGVKVDADWVSSDESVLIVDNGVVTALAQGSVTLSVTAQGTQIGDSMTITVTDDSRKAVADLISRVSEEYASEESVTALNERAQMLSRCTSEDTVIVYKALENLMLCASTQGVQTGEQNSIADIAAELEIDEATARQAVESMYYSNQNDDDNVTLSFTGDCTFGYLEDNDALDRFPAVYRNSGSITYPFDRVMHIFNSDDLTVVNYEGTLAQAGSIKADKRFHVRGEPEYALILPQSSVEVANLANNHAYDYLEEGFNRTVSLIEQEGVATVSAQSPYITTIDGIETVMLAAGHKKHPEVITDVVETMLSQIAQYKRADNLVVVNLHWGGEYCTAPVQEQITAAHALLDAGADIIIGHHAHIIQGIEVYNGKVIAYGLGNFSYGGRSDMVERESFILRAVFKQDDQGTVYMSDWGVVPCYATGTGSLSNDFRPISLYGDDAAEMMSLLKVRSLEIGSSADIPFFTYN